MNLQGKVFLFGPFRMDVAQRALWREGQAVPLTPKEFDTLLVLVENSGELVGKEAIVSRVWPDTFVADSSLTRNISVLRKALGEDVIETLPKFGYRLALPVRRVPEVNSAASSPTAATNPVPAVLPPAAEGGTHRPALRPRWLGIALAIVLLVVAAQLYVPLPHHAASPVKSRPAVAVLGFKNLSGRPEAAWLSTALSEMLNTELALGEKLLMVPEETVDRAKVELPLADADSFSPPTLVKIHKDLGADFVVTGSYLQVGGPGGGKVRLDLHLQNAATGETLISVSDTSDEPEISDLVARTGGRLRQKLGVGELTVAEATALKASLPYNPEAARLYSEGRVKLRLLDPLAARELLEQAVAAEPGHPLPHAALASVWSALGYDEKARIEARKAFDLSANLAREDRLWIEGGYRETVSEWQKALDVYRSLWTLFPDNVDYGLRLASLQVTVGRSTDAFETLAVLRKLPWPAGNDPRIDIEEAHAAEALGDFRREQQAAARGADKGSTQHAGLLVARAWMMQGSAWYNLGDLGQAARALDQAKAVYAASGDKTGEAAAMSLMARVRLLQGDLDGAGATWKAALGIYRQIGNRGGVAAELSHLGAWRFWYDDIAGAKPFFEQSLVIYREIGNRQGVAAQLHHIGDVISVLGDLPGARRDYDEALATDRELGNQGAVARDLGAIGDLLCVQGNLLEAQNKLTEVLAISGKIGAKEERADTLSGLSQVLRARGDLSEAREKLQEAVAIQRELGENSHVYTNSTLLAELAIEQGQPAEAEALIREAGKEHLADNRQADPAAFELLSRALLAQGKRAEAAKAATRASALLNKTQRLDTRFAVEITAARALAASGDRGDAVQAAKSLEATLARTRKLGYLGYEFEARLALAETELRLGNTTAGHVRLAALEREARGKGFELVARKARAFAAKA